jgi:cellulose synthase/poly-beta-1,6-N-acetylglucosamine synthase-like glycosyltransferase
VAQLMLLALVLYWGSVALLGWVYVAYPLLALVYGRIKPVRIAEQSAWPALVSVGLAVHDGAGQIGERVADILAQSTPFALEVIVASDGSDDETARIIAATSAIDPRVRLLELPRSGQSAAQAAIFTAARGDVVILTDLETRFAPGCLEALVGPMRDPQVGCSTGVLRWRFDEATATARHEGLYWRYEQAVRRWENRAGWLTAATGALLAVRRSLYRPVPAHASLDQMLPLIARDNAQRVVIARSAIGSDRGTVGLREQFLSRMRIATQGIEANLRMSLRITPWRRPGSFLALWSHKLLRWATPYLALLAALDGSYLALGGESVLYWLLAALAVIGAVLAVIGFVATKLRRPLPLPIPLASFALTVAVVNAAFALAWLNVLSRRPISAWENGGTHIAEESAS